MEPLLIRIIFETLILTITYSDLALLDKEGIVIVSNLITNDKIDL